MKLDNQVAVVTGGGSGIGRQIALSFAAEGARVAIADVDLDGAHRTVERIAAAGGPEAIVLHMDVTDEAAVDEGIDSVARRFGRIDTLVSNAGIQRVHPIESFPLADFRRLMAIHVEGAFLTTRAAVRHMYPQGSGSLIYMGSVHSHEASALKSAYVAAKHAILGLSRVAAKEGAAHGVRANVICPGFVRTPLVDRQIPEQAKELGISEQEVVSRVMLGETVDQRFTTMQDVADVAVFLAGFGNNALTGQSIIVSHGWCMK